MTEFEKTLKREREELQKLLTHRAARPTERHLDILTTDPNRAAEQSRDLLRELKKDLSQVADNLKSAKKQADGSE